ncbi:MAG: hypothetical protein K2P79_08960 [Sphingomonas sp.]|nr:hypothetical protein [Sphingomonas sp.]
MLRKFILPLLAITGIAVPLAETPAAAQSIVQIQYHGGHGSRGGYGIGGYGGGYGRGGYGGGYGNGYYGNSYYYGGYSGYDDRYRDYHHEFKHHHFHDGDRYEYERSYRDHDHDRYDRRGDYYRY